MPAAKRGSQFTHPSQGTGLTWADPSPGRGPIWAGLSTQEPCTEPLLQSTPALFLGRAGSEHLRAGYGLTAAPGQVGDPGLYSVWPPSTGLPEASTAPTALGLCLHPPLLSLTPGFLSLGKSLLEILSHSRPRKND